MFFFFKASWWFRNSSGKLRRRLYRGLRRRRTLNRCERTSERLPYWRSCKGNSLPNWDSFYQGRSIFVERQVSYSTLLTFLFGCLARDVNFPLGYIIFVQLACLTNWGSLSCQIWSQLNNPLGETWSYAQIIFLANLARNGGIKKDA